MTPRWCVLYLLHVLHRVIWHAAPQFACLRCFTPRVHTEIEQLRLSPQTINNHSRRVSVSEKTVNFVRIYMEDCTQFKRSAYLATPS